MKQTTAENERDVKIGKVTLHLTNQNKLYWQKEGITKGDLINYYDNISPFILPYLKDRPQSMHRFPNGINAPSFYQKDVDPEKIPSWLKSESIFSSSNNENIDYLICNDKATLLYMANLGCIEINPWSSRISKPDNPDWLVIDLDPEAIIFKEVVKTALEVRKVFDTLEIGSYCKTSGATGLHIFVPLAAKYNYEIVRKFGSVITEMVNQRLPNITSVLRSPSKRHNRVYLDFLQNSKGQTLAAPYSVRPKPGATVSTPLEWNEVNPKLDPSALTMKTILNRLDKKGDLWKPILKTGANIERALKKMS
jgi:bifunctional non-homologous end joining protein LigD